MESDIANKIIVSLFLNLSRYQLDYLSYMSWPRDVIAGTGRITAHRMAEFEASTLLENPSIQQLVIKSFHQNGYVLLRGLLSSKECMECRSEIIQHLRDRMLVSFEGDNDGNHIIMKTKGNSIKQNISIISKKIKQKSNRINSKITEKNNKPSNKNDLKIPPELQSSSPNLHPLHTSTFPNLMSFQPWIKSTLSIISYLSHPTLISTSHLLLSHLFSTSISVPIPFKWLRAVGTGLFTGLHCDSVYVGHISPHLVTAWIPIGIVSTSEGSLVVASGSHSNKLWKETRDGYGSGKVGGDGTSSGWLTTDPNDLNVLLTKNNEPSVSAMQGNESEDMNAKQDDSITNSKQADTSVNREDPFSQPSILENPMGWVSADFEAGDVCFLNLKVMHMTATNVTDCWRLSCDTRWAGL